MRGVEGVLGWGSEAEWEGESVGGPAVVCNMLA